MPVSAITVGYIVDFVYINSTRINRNFHWHHFASSSTIGVFDCNTPEPSNGDQSSEWAELRKQWMAHVIQAADPEDVPENWLAVYGEPNYDLNTLVERIKQKREAVIPAVWAPKIVEHPDYPTPADLR